MLTEEDNELLIKDLCARFPYCVKVLNSTFADITIQTLLGRISEDTFVMHETYKEVSGDDFRMVRDGVNYTGHIEDIKPYLRSLKSMTEEERKELYCIDGVISVDFEFQPYQMVHLLKSHNVIDWLNKKMFDYRTDDDGLTMIKKGIAIEAPEGMYNKI